MNQIEIFYKALAEDKEMQEKAEAYNNKMKKEQPAEEESLRLIVEFANSEGYVFSTEELKGYMEKQKAVELTDEELEQVSAGVLADEACRIIGASGACTCFIGGGGPTEYGDYWVFNKKYTKRYVVCPFWGFVVLE